MIASLHGKLEALGTDSVIINVGGVGFQVYVPTSTLSTLGSIGDEVSVYTHFHLREDNASLYGFASIEERDFFQVLIGVSGVGPKVALAVLSTMTVEQATLAIATGSTEMLTSVPGIGNRIAGRLVLELKDKIGTIPTIISAAGQENADVLAALTSLGYSMGEASRAVSSLPRTPNLGLEEKVKMALAYFTRK